MNKENELIINDVNVANCEFIMSAGFSFPQCKKEIRESSFSTACQQHEDCIYKQLQRKIIECESLKNWRNTAIKHIKELVVYKNTQLGRSTQNGIEGLTILNEVMKNADF